MIEVRSLPEPLVIGSCGQRWMEHTGITGISPPVTIPASCIPGRPRRCWQGLQLIEVTMDDWQGQSVHVACWVFDCFSVYDSSGSVDLVLLVRWSVRQGRGWQKTVANFNRCVHLPFDRVKVKAKHGSPYWMFFEEYMDSTPLTPKADLLWLNFCHVHRGVELSEFPESVIIEAQWQRITVDILLIFRGTKIRLFADKNMDLPGLMIF